MRKEITIVISFICTFCRSLDSCVATNTPDTELLQWVTSQDGCYFNEAKQEVRPTSSTGYPSAVGVFAIDKISKGEVLATIPWSVIIDSEEAYPDEEEDVDRLFAEEESTLSCGTIRNLIKELREEYPSFSYGKYLTYLKSRPKGALPESWSEHARALFLHIVGPRSQRSRLLEDPFDLMEYEWEHLCGGSDGELETQAVFLFSTFGTPHGLLVPLFDFYGHRNGRYFNTETKVEYGEYFQLYATRDIEVGEQLHSSLTDCVACLLEEDEPSYGTAELFRDRGFIEDFPQSWTIRDGGFDLVTEKDGISSTHTFPGGELGFVLSENDENANELEVTFLFDQEQVFYLSEMFARQLRRLGRIETIEYGREHNDSITDMSEEEWNKIYEFYDSLQTALLQAIMKLDAIENEKFGCVMMEDYADLEDDNDGEHECRSSGWQNSQSHYTEFQTEVDTLAYNPQICDSSELIDFHSYTHFETASTNYQEMEWQYREEDEDVCLHLDSVLQICTSYRPHYHEFFTHWPARFVKDVRRVIFLGSGDAMNLHEILKYPNLEKVVGLELDQQITRQSFQYFKTQPHYNDPRVEWWYGDATKTLPLLPREYWGSFDLLLVDLSETVVSLHVTGQHDILDVVSLLLKPEGVMLENELYVDKMSRHFDHTVQIFYGSPKVCTQVHTVSSNAADFLRSPIYEHDVDNYLIDEIQTPTDRYDWIHDYIRTTPKGRGECGGEASEQPETLQGKKAGILQIVEAERVAMDFTDTNKTIATILSNQGFNIISVEHGSDDTVMFVLEEGYVVARTRPQDNYIGFDLNLWGNFERMHQLGPAIVEGVQSETSSQFRVVVGGMHGAKTWEKDQETIGVVLSTEKKCTVDNVDAMDELKEETILNACLPAFISLTASHHEITTVVVVCGRDIEDCSSVKVLEQQRDVQVFPFLPCAAVEAALEEDDADELYDVMAECEITINSKLNHLPSDISGFVVDPSASMEMLKIFNSIWSAMDNREMLLDDPYFMASSYLHGERDRRRFLDDYRKADHEGYLSLGEIAIKGKRSFMGWKLLVDGFEHPVAEIMKVEGMIRESLNADVRVRLIEGGEKHSTADLHSEKLTYTPAAYDRRPNAEQEASQRAIGRQAIFQLDLIEGKTMLPLKEHMKQFRRTLDNMEYSSVTVKLVENVGLGALITAQFLQGNALLTFDGKDHIDVNLFVHDQRKDLADSFIEKFIESTDGTMQLSLRDDIPRGYGNVVTFSHESHAAFQAKLDAVLS